MTRRPVAPRGWKRGVVVGALFGLAGAFLVLRGEREKALASRGEPREEKSRRIAARDDAPAVAIASRPEARSEIASEDAKEVRGRVVDEDGRAIVGAHVTLHESVRGERGPEKAQTTSGALGAFRFALPRAEPADGEERFVVQADQKVNGAWVLAWREAIAGGAPVDLVLRAPSAQRFVVFEIVDGATDRRLEATPQAPSLRASDGGEARFVERGYPRWVERAFGEYALRIDDLEPATYGVFFVTPDHREGRAEIHAADFAAEPHVPIVVRVTSFGSLRGRVVDADTSEAVAGARVLLQWRRPLLPDGRPAIGLEWDEVADHRAGDDGAFAFEVPRSGEFELLVLADGFVTQERNVGAWRGDPRAESPVTVRLVRAASISGRVVDAEGKPALRAMVAITKPGGGGLLIKSDGEGRFALKGLVPGSYQATTPDGERALVLAGGDKVEITLLKP